MNKPLPKTFRKPKPSPARVAAFECITEVNRNGAYANILLPQLLEKSSLEERDRAFATELSYGTLRMQGRYDWAIAHQSERPFSELDSKVVDLLRLGLHQIWTMRVPDHAAVSETVELARYVAGESKATFINAVLRNIMRQPDALENYLADTSVPELERLAIEYSHPTWVISAFYDQLQDWNRVRALLEIDNVPVAPHLVAWPGKSTVDELLSLGGSPLPPGRYAVLSEHSPLSYSPIVERRAGVQDLGSQLLAQYFYDLSESLRSESQDLSWLDLCAGPGGKSAWLYNMLETAHPNDSFLANEPTEHRADLVARVVPRAKILTNDGRYPELFAQKFDRILVDAPCTGLGALRRRPEARWRKSLTDLKELIPLQRDLIDGAYELLNPGGLLAYATCSPHIAETVGQVLDAQYRHKDLKLVSLFNGVAPEQYQGKIPGTMQLWTDRDATDSMFMAVFQKQGS